MCTLFQVRLRHDMTEVEVDGVRDSKRYEMSCGKLTSLVFGGVSPRDKQVVSGMLVCIIIGYTLVLVLCR